MEKPSKRLPVSPPRSSNCGHIGEDFFDFVFIHGNVFCLVLASGLTVTKKICQTKNQFVICISLQSLDVTIRVCGKGFDFGPEPESAKAVALRIMTAKASISA